MTPSNATKNGKSSTRGKKLAAGKKVSEVKPLSYQYYVAIKGTKQGKF